MNHEREIWVIDDDTLYVRELLKALSSELAGFTPIKFITAAPVLAALEAGKRPSAVILDMMLAHDEWDNPVEWPPGTNPAKNGIAIASKLLQCGVTSAVIGVITAVINKAHREPLLQAGILEGHILIKPAAIDRIRELVRRILAAAKVP